MTNSAMTSISKAIDALYNLDYVVHDSSLEKEISAFKQNIAQDYFTVVVLGEFKRGKSSFINALLGRELLPTDVLPETATINMLFYDEKPWLHVRYKNGLEEEGDVSLDYLKKFSANSRDKQVENVDYIKIGYPLELLNKRVVLVDTPGVADLDDMRTDLTYGFLPYANAVIFLLDANTPLTQTEKVFIEEHLIPQGINDIMFVVNKYDCIDDEEDEDFLDDLNLRLSTVFKMDTPDAKLKSYSLLPLSATMALRGLESGDSKLLSVSGINEVHDSLWQMLSEGNITQKKQHHAKVYFQRIGDHIIKNINIQINALQSTIDDLSMVESTLLEEINNINEYSSVIDSYISSIQDKIFAICDKSIQFFGQKLQEDALEQIDLYHGEEFKDFIENNVARRIQKSINNWIGANTPQIIFLVKMLEREISIGLSHQFNQHIEIKLNSHGSLEPWKNSLRISAVDISNTGFQAGAIAAVGGMGLLAIAGTSLMPLVSFAALPYLKSYMVKKKLVEAKQEVKPLISSQINKVRQQLAKDVQMYIISECRKVKNNTDYAYNTLLEKMKEGISAQIREKRSMSEDQKGQIIKLREEAQKVKEIVASIGG